jgi:hypothetical protein
MSVIKHVTKCLLKAEIMKQKIQLFLENGSVNTRLEVNDSVAVRDAYTKIDELLESVFSLRSVPKLCNGDQLSISFKNIKGLNLAAVNYTTLQVSRLLR